MSHRLKNEVRMKNLLFVTILLFITVIFTGCNAPTAPASGSSTTLPNGDIITVTAPKLDPPVQFVDRQGKPYANMKVTINDSVSNADYTTDANGIIEVTVASGTVLTLVKNLTVASSQNEYAF